MRETVFDWPSSESPSSKEMESLQSREVREYGAGSVAYINGKA